MAVSTDTQLDLAARLGRVQELIAAAAGRSPDQAPVTIVGVSKTATRQEVDAAIAAGLRHVAENRVQVAAEKFASPLPHDVTLHLIGQLQTNKAKAVARLFDVVESVDRLSLIEALERAAQGRGAPLPVLLQVNIAGESQKAGCDPAEARELAVAIQHSPSLQLQGLMTIAPLVSDPEEVRPVFRGLRELRDRLLDGDPSLALPVLSMGMSNDFTVAVEEGSTEVRIGRAIFGDA